MNKCMQHKLAIVLVTAIFGSVAASSAVFARGWGGGGGHRGGFGGAHMSHIVNGTPQRVLGKELTVTLKFISLTNLRRESILINTDQIIKVKNDWAEHPGSNAVV